MRVVFNLDEIYGKRPKDVATLFRKRGLNPARPYKARVSSNGIIIEQD